MSYYKKLSTPIRVGECYRNGISCYKALEAMPSIGEAGYITEDELGDSMEQFCTTLSNESKRTQYSTALQRGINDHGVPCEIMVDNGSYWESFNASKAPKKSPNI